MLCPSCGNESKTVDSRPSSDGTAVRRRRECLSCKLRWSTREQVEERTPDFAALDDVRESLRVLQQALGRTMRRVEDIVKSK